MSLEICKWTCLSWTTKISLLEWHRKPSQPFCLLMVGTTKRRPGGAIKSVGQRHHFPVYGEILRVNHQPALLGNLELQLIKCSRARMIWSLLFCQTWCSSRFWNCYKATLKMWTTWKMWTQHFAKLLRITSTSFTMNTFASTTRQSTSASSLVVQYSS